MTKKEMCKKRNSYLAGLAASERAPTTIAQYRRETGRFLASIEEGNVTKETVIRYKEELAGRYKPGTVNVKLAALNSFFSFLGLPELKVKQLKVQRTAYCSEDRELTREDYRKLVGTAQAQGKERLALVIQTICGTGIRVSELQYFTVDAVKRGEVEVRNKGKIRRILIPGKLKKALLRYAKGRKISSGAIFITKNGNPLNRSNLWRQMKNLCAAAGVQESKVFPHNLRHLFARTFYSIDKDIARLADVLGHSSINTTRIYIMSDGEEHRRQLDRLGLVL